MSTISTDQVRLDTQGTPADEVARLAEQDSDTLARLIVNDTLNKFIADLSPSSFSDNRAEAPIPYQGWFWRSVDFFAPRGITIAEGDGQIAVCQNNKWDYPQRYLTDVERDEFLRLVWEAYRAGNAGGIVSEIYEARDKAIAKAGEFIAALKIGDPE